MSLIFISNAGFVGVAMIRFNQQVSLYLTSCEPSRYWKFPRPLRPPAFFASFFDDIPFPRWRNPLCDPIERVDADRDLNLGLPAWDVAMRCWAGFFMGAVSPIRKTCSSHFPLLNLQLSRVESTIILWG